VTILAGTEEAQRRLMIDDNMALLSCKYVQACCTQRKGDSTKNSSATKKVIVQQTKRSVE
jgi:hypothetical protein